MYKSLLILFVLCAAAYANVDFAGFTLVRLDPSVGFTNINISKGEKIILQIESNPTTGYNWELVNNNELQSNNVLKFLNDNVNGEYESKAHRQNVVGVGGNTFMKFEGVNAGKSSIKIQYKQSWETDFLKSVEVEVTVSN